MLLSIPLRSIANVMGLGLLAAFTVFRVLGFARGKWLSALGYWEGELPVLPKEHLAFAVGGFRLATFWLWIPVGWGALALTRRVPRPVLEVATERP